MPQTDLYHEPVKRALIKDGWTITDDPFNLEYKGLRLYADLGAEKTLAAEKEETKIVVEIKVFGSASPITELERAVGQYRIYQMILRRNLPERELYLAVAADIYADFFQRAAIQDIIAEEAMRLLVFDPRKEEVVRWIK